VRRMMIAGDVELPLVENSQILRAGEQRRYDDVAGILHSVDVADFVAVVGGYRELSNPHARAHELNDDIGIELKSVCIAFKRNLLKRLHGIEPVSGVKLGE